MSQGRIVVVTGGAQGIGEAAVRRFAVGGDLVFVLDIDDDRGAALSRSLQACTFIHCDVTSESQVVDTFEQIGRDVSRVDALINNAGGFPDRRGLEETTITQWDQTLALNLTSIFLVTRSALPLLRGSEAARIVNIGSLAGQTAGWPTSPSYAAAKGGVHSLTRVLASELAREGIAVNALAPSAVDTERIRSLRDVEELRRTSAEIPLGRYQTPGEVAEWIWFLASAEAGFMTGQTVSVNGGRFMS